MDAEVRQASGLTDRVLDDWLETLTTGEKGICEPASRLTPDQLDKLYVHAGSRALAEKSLVEVEAPATIFGDIHGQFEPLYIMLMNEFVDFDRMRLKDRRIVFLGDIVDRGSQSVRSITFLFCLYLRHPQHIFITRGNHEIPCINKRYELWKELMSEWGKDGERLYNSVNYAFSCLPFVALIGKRILAMHGGISPKLESWDCLRNIKRPIMEVDKKGLLCDLLWSDPVHMIAITKGAKQYVWNKERGLSWKFGEEEVKKLMEMLDLDLIVRAHITTNGFHEFCSRMLITVFSAPSYEDHHNMATVMRIGRSLKIAGAFYRDKNDTAAYVPDADKTQYIGATELPEQKVQKPIEKKPEVKKKRGLFNFKRPSSSYDAGFGAVGVVCLVAIIGFGYFSSATSTAFAPPYTLGQISEMSLKLARVVNGIFIGESAASGSLDKKALVDEFFSFGPEVSLDSLSKSSVSGLAENLNSIKTVIDKECSGGCEVTKSVMAGIDAVSKFQDKVPILQKALEASEEKGINMISQMNSLVVGLNDVFQNSALADFETNVKYVIENAAKSSTSEYRSAYFAAEGFLNSASKLFKLILDSGKLFDEFQGATIEKMQSNLALISPVKDISENFKQQQSFIAPLRSELEKMKTTYQELTKTLESGKVKKIEESLDYFSKMRHSSNIGNSLTAGFVNGFEDLKKVSADIQDNWLKTLLNPSLNVTALNPKVSELDKVYKDFEALHLSFKKVSLTNYAQLSTFKTILFENAKTTKEIFDLATTYRTCVNFFNFAPRFDMDVSKSIATLKNGPASIANLKTSIESFLKLHKADLESVPAIVEIMKDSEKLAAKIKETPEYLNETVTLFSGIQDGLTTIDYAIAETWLHQADVGTVGTSSKEFIEKSGIISALNCFQEKYKLGRLQELNPSTKKLTTLKTGDPTMESILKQSTSINNLVVEWKKVEPTLSKTSKSKRASGPELKTISKDFGDISSLVKNIADIVRFEQDVNSLIEGSKEIDSAIEGIQDSNKKAQLKKFWNSEVVASLKTNLKLAKTMSADVAKMKEINKAADFQTPFESAANVENCHIDFSELASSLSGNIKDQKVSTSLDALKTFDLKFVKMEKSKVGSVLNNLQSFFNSFFGIETSKTTQKMTQSCDDGECSTEGTKTEETSNILMYCGIGGGVALIGAIVASIYYRKDIKKWIDSRSNKKPEKPEKPDTNKDGGKPSPYTVHEQDGNKIIELNSMRHGKKEKTSAEPSTSQSQDIEKGSTKPPAEVEKPNKKANDKAVPRQNKPPRMPRLEDGGCLGVEDIGDYDNDDEKKKYRVELINMGCTDEIADEELVYRDDKVTGHRNLNHHSLEGAPLFTLSYFPRALSRLEKVPQDPNDKPDRQNIIDFRDKNYKPDNLFHYLGDEVVKEFPVEFLSQNGIDSSTKTCQPADIMSTARDDSNRVMKTAEEKSKDPSKRSSAGEEGKKCDSSSEVESGEEKGSSGLTNPEDAQEGNSRALTPVVFSSSIVSEY